MPHPLRCACGALQGVVEPTARANHAVCYCRDCQAFAHALSRPAAVLDAQGGTQIVQIAPAAVTLTRGAENLACLRLTPGGLLRWYARCCDTPIGNTLATPALSFVGLIHPGLEGPGPTIDETFGPVRCRVNTHGARGLPRPRQSGVPRAILWFLSTLIRARLTGDHRRTPFFDPAGAPVAAPRILTPDERLALARAVEAP